MNTTLGYGGVGGSSLLPTSIVVQNGELHLIWSEWPANGHMPVGRSFNITEHLKEIIRAEIQAANERERA